QRRFDDAEASYRKALSLAPSWPGIRRNLGMLMLVLNRWKEGFELFEERLAFSDGLLAPKWRHLRWDGSPLKGRRVLLHAENGLGDTIQYVRYVPNLIAAGGRVVMLSQPELYRLLQRMPGIEELRVEGGPVPSFDVLCPVMSCPRAFGTRLETIPAAIPYLTPDPSLAEHWRQRLAPHRGRLTVGLVWSASKTIKEGWSRSPPPGAFARLATAANHGVRFVSLQKGPPAKDAPAGIDLLDWTEELHDMADTAALAANLDLVIAVDTSVAHLAGAIGKACWVLLCEPADWKWMLDRTDSPWYPTMRLFRQPKPGDWQTPIEQVLDALLERT
ncbi:MAG TPA: hypothetical protein VH370_25400, partial [Humisphaera sp.]|nr:hypothetical protein [Humisphaera sp.]